MEDMNILAFFLSYPSLPIDASDESSEEAIKRGDEFHTYIWGEKGYRYTPKITFIYRLW